MPRNPLMTLMRRTMHTQRMALIAWHIARQDLTAAENLRTYIRHLRRSDRLKRALDDYSIDS